MDVHDPVDFGTRARAAALMERGSALRSALQRIYPGISNEASAGAEGMQDAQVVCEARAAQGVAIGPYGWPQKLGMWACCPEAALRPPAPAQHLHGELE